MTGGGPYRLKPGEWTDDTSMALCLAASLVEEEAFDPQDQMDRYVRWWKEGYFSSTGKHFDIGNTVRQALERYMDTGNPFSGPTDPLASGNGCIMRLAPVPMFCFPDEELAADLAAEPDHRLADHVLLGREREHVALARRFPPHDEPRLVAERAKSRAQEDHVEGRTPDVQAREDPEDAQSSPCPGTRCLSHSLPDTPRPVAGG